MVDLNTIDVIAPNFKQRLSGVTSTVIRLVAVTGQTDLDHGLCTTDARSCPKYPLGIADHNVTQRTCSQPCLARPPQCRNDSWAGFEIRP